MSATPDMIAALRRMVNEPTAETYGSASLAAMIEAYPLPDADDRQPTDVDWTPTYDLAMAAADVWEEKAAAQAGAFDFDADGASYSRSQVYQQAMDMARRYRARRAARSVFVPAIKDRSDETWPS